MLQVALDHPSITPEAVRSDRATVPAQAVVEVPIER
jgi:hypothetical protein